MSLLIKESLYSVLDSRCSLTVAGENWMNCYLASLPEESILVKQKFKWMQQDLNPQPLSL